MEAARGVTAAEDGQSTGETRAGPCREPVAPGLTGATHIIHGRKASTYLGIFDSPPPADGSCKSGKAGKAGKKTLAAASGDEGTCAAEEAWKKKKKKKKREERESECWGGAKLAALASEAQHDLELYTQRSSAAVSSHESLGKPISSATYFPHKLKEDAGGGVAGQGQQVLSVELNSEVSSLSASDEEAIEDSEEDEDGEESGGNNTREDELDDDDERNVISSSETREFPLKVELQPFTDNVGGHTAIFRFSERAVCKALVNQENSWYETIELKHPELLQFMPRYFGVLNVRQHFTSKGEFLNSIPAKEPKAVDIGNPPPSPDNVDAPTTPRLEPLHHTTSLPLVEEKPLPEVCLNDNKHIIPDSLWCKYSHSPSSLPSQESWAAKSECLANSNTHARTGSDTAGHSSYPTGSTLINTRLKELIIEEVFGQSSNRIQQPNFHDNHAHQHRHFRNSSIPIDKNSGDTMRIQSSDCLTNFPKNKQSRSSSTSSSTANKFISKKKRHDSHNSLVDLREMHRGLYCGPENELFKLEDDLSLTASVPNSPKSKSQHESVSYEEHSHTVVSKFILLEDLTRKLNKPCVLDLKMGTRQYGVDAKRSKQLSQREKCRNTTSRKLGVRICGLKIWNKDYYITRDKYFGRRVRIGWQFVRVLARFLYDGVSRRSILKQLPCLVRQLETLYSEAIKLKSYRMYGSSLLLMYDGNNPSSKRCKVKLNLIDFARCVTKKDIDTSIGTFKIPPKNPELEDRGFLRGLRSLKFYLLVIWNHLTGDHPLVYDEESLQEFLDSDESFNKPWDWIDEFDKEDEARVHDPNDELRKKWRKYELIFDVEPRCADDDVSE
ncbi:AaceriAAR184Wp [[Ashbya] aceris (nom. inval.)]|nr:AaceriAAR184Wp [[Ashbya] aceris (nom. inval.)]